MQRTSGGTVWGFTGEGARRLLALLFAGLTLSCAPVAEEHPRLVIEPMACDAEKCDGPQLRSLIEKPTAADMGDLLNVAAEFGSRELNHYLRTAQVVELGDLAAELRGRARVSPPTMFALPSANAGATVRDIDELVTGLTYRYGERALMTEVNRIRREYLASNHEGHTLYAETAFGVAGDLSFLWNIAAPALDAAGVEGEGPDSTVRMGFLGGKAWEGRLVAPFRSELEAHAQGNALTLVDDVRNFILWEDMGDFRAMRPGELIALSSQGRAGLSFGANIPLATFDVSQGTVSPTLNFSVQIGLETNSLDIQVVRLEGDELVVDVGVRDIVRDSIHIGIKNDFVFDELLGGQVDIGGAEVDIGRLGEKALEKLLEQKLRLFRLFFEEGQTTEKRLSISRMRFRLDHGHFAGFPDDALEKALAQAVHGDARLGQMLAAAGHPGVLVELDLARTAHSEWESLNLDVLGMRFVSRDVEREASVLIQRPDEVRAILGREIERQRGFLFWSHEFARTSLTGLVAEPHGRIEDLHSFYMRMADHDGTLDRNKVLDHIDGLILALGGLDLLRSLEARGYELEVLVRDRTAAFCEEYNRDRDPEQQYRTWQCKQVVLEEDDVHEARNAAVAAVEEELTGITGLSEKHKLLLDKAATLRVIVPMVHDEAFFGEPSAQIAFDIRLDDGALARLMRTPGEEVASTIAQYLSYAAIDRDESPTAADNGDRRAVERDNRDELAEIADAWDRSREQYLAEMRRGALTVDGYIGAFSERGMYIMLDPNALDIYESAVVATPAHRRAQIFDDLYSTIHEIADRIDVRDRSYDLPPQRVLAYTFFILAQEAKRRAEPGNALPEASVFFDFDLETSHLYRSYGYEGFALNAQSPDSLGGETFDIRALFGN